MTEHGGVLLKARGEGDSTFSVFTRASDAARAVAAARRELHAADWPTQEPLSVRMALHTGEALERDGDYYGRTVNRAARLRSIADGDRPLVSAATAQLLADELAPGQHLVELGMRELRDLDRPELVYLLVDDAVPTRTVDAAGREHRAGRSRSPRRRACATPRCSWAAPRRSQSCATSRVRRTGATGRSRSSAANPGSARRRSRRSSRSSCTTPVGSCSTAGATPG